MPIIRCPTCATELDVDAGWVGRAVRCATCRTEFVATGGPPRLAVARPVTLPHADDDPPRRVRRRTKPFTARVFWATLFVFGVLLLACCGIVGFGAVARLAGPVRFEPSDWREQALPDGTAAVRFPAAPRSEPIPGLGPVPAGVAYQYDAPPPKDATVRFSAFDLPAGDPAVFETTYRDVRDAIARGVNGQVVREARLTVQGYDAREAEFAAGPATVVYRMVFVPGRAKNRVVTVLAGGRHLSPADRAAFLDSLTLTGRN